jgi:hypothetical protein
VVDLVMVEEVWECGGPKAKGGKNYKQGYWTGGIQLHNIQTVASGFFPTVGQAANLSAVPLLVQSLAIWMTQLEI